MAFLNKTGLERLWAHIVSQLGHKVEKVDGKGLSTNDFTNEEKEKLANLSTEGLASEEYVDNAVSVGVANLVNSAPETLDTLGEIATALEENADVVEVLENAVGESVRHVEQELSEDQQSQARTNIGIDYATDEEVLAAMIEADIIPAIETENGALLSSAENTILIM